jgi:hypothetical protein
MSVARTGGASIAWTDNSTTKTLAVDCTGADFLIVFVAWRNTGTTTLSAFTYNGVAMTRVGSVFTSASPRQDVDIFYLVAPASGSHNFSVTASAAIGGAGNDGVIYAHACSGVDSGTPIGTAVAFEAISPFSALDIALSAATGDLCIDVAFVNGTTSSFTADAGQTATGTVAASSVCDVNSSREAGAASVAMGWDYAPSASFNAVQRGVPIKAAAAASTHAGPLVNGALIKKLVNGALIA